MGRMLDALNHAAARHEQRKETPAPCAAPTPQPVDDEPEESSEVPFIEVGGPRLVIDASPDVRAAMSAAPASRPATPADKQVAPSASARAEVAEDSPACPPTIALWCSWTLRPGVKVDS